MWSRLGTFAGRACTSAANSGCCGSLLSGGILVACSCHTVDGTYSSRRSVSPIIQREQCIAQLVRSLSLLEDESRRQPAFASSVSQSKRTRSPCWRAFASARFGAAACLCKLLFPESKLSSNRPKSLRVPGMHRASRSRLHFALVTQGCLDEPASGRTSAFCKLARIHDRALFLSAFAGCFGTTCIWHRHLSPRSRPKSRQASLLGQVRGCTVHPPGIGAKRQGKSTKNCLRSNSNS